MMTSQRTLIVRVQGTDSTFFKYNDKGLVIQVNYKLSYLKSTSTITYNSSGKLTSIVSSDQDVTSQLYEYSDDEKTCKIYTVDGGIKTLYVTNSFDDKGFLMKTTSPNTAYTRYEYDSNGNFVKEYVSISNGEYLSSVISYDDKKSSPLPFNSTIFVANPYGNSHSAIITNYLPSSDTIKTINCILLNTLPPAR